jgi:hypothetical protein
MKYRFSLIRIVNLLYVIYNDLYSLDPTKENIEKIKKKIDVVILALNKQTRLMGMQTDFVSQLPKIKKRFGIQ